MSKLARRHRRRKFRKNPSSAPKRNPPLAHDILQWVAPGFAGFAATRLLTRITQTQLEKRIPKLSKHAGAIASVGSFLASWLLGNRVALIAKYHTPITVGSAIAAAQSILQIYAPNKLGWIVSDASSAPKPVAAAPAQQALPPHMEEVHDDPRWYTYDDMAGGSLAKAKTWSPNITPPAEDTAPISAPQDGDDELAAGIFGGN